MKKLFRIIEITEQLAAGISSNEYEPHFHDFEEIVIVSSGQLTHYIDFNVDIVKAPFVSYISMGKMHKVAPEKDLRGWIIDYKPEFIPDSKLNFYSNFLNFTNIPLSSEGAIGRFDNLCRIIKAEYSEEINDLNTIRHLVNGLISMIDTERKGSISIDTSGKFSQITAFNNFLRILEENFRRNEGISFYADKMNMSGRNLNIICQNIFSKSVTEIIETRKLIEAKRMLLYTGKSISEIGFDLGYSEKSYFTRVFHSKTGLTPTHFREMAKVIIS